MISRLVKGATYSVLKRDTKTYFKSPLEHLLCAGSPGGFVNILHFADRYIVNIRDLLGEGGRSAELWRKKGVRETKCTRHERKESWQKEEARMVLVVLEDGLKEEEL